MSNPFGILFPFISPLLKFIKWIKKQKNLTEAQERLGMAIKNEAKIYMEKYEQLGKVTDNLIDLLDKLENMVTGELINSIIVESSEGLYAYGDIIKSYVDLSIAIKEFSTMETLMEKLKPNGFLYEYVCKIRDTVKDYNTIIIGGEYLRFMLAYEDKIFKKIKKKDTEEANKLMEKYVHLLTTKFQNAFIIMSNRRRFKKKYIKSIFIHNLKYLKEAKNRMIIDVPEDQILEFIPKKLLPITMIFEEIRKIEYHPKKGHRRQLPKPRRARS